MPDLQRPNDRCACGSGKKVKKCCRSIVERGGPVKQAVRASKTALTGLASIVLLLAGSSLK